MKKISFLILLIVTSWAQADNPTDLSQVSTPESIDQIKLLTTFLLFELAVIAFLLLRMKRHKDEAKSKQIELEQQIESQKNHIDLLEKNQSFDIDALSGLKSRLFIYEYIKQLILDKPDTSWNLTLISIDQFKSINETYGHLAGDDVIKSLGDLLTKELNIDLVARWGDKELLCLVRSDSKSNQQLCTQIQELLSKQTIKAQGHSLTISTSIGITQFPLKEYKNLDWEWSVKLLHYALLKAQEAGGNKWNIVQLNSAKEFDYSTSDTVQELIDSGVLKLIEKG